MAKKKRDGPLTDADLRGAKWEGKDYWLSDGGARGAGRLMAKLTQSGWSFYYRYKDSAKRWRFCYSPSTTKKASAA